LTEEKKRQEIRESVKQKAIESIQEKERLVELSKAKEEEQREVARKRYINDQREEENFKKLQKHQ